MIDWTILAFIFVGFFAQMMDGSLGMSYGTISNTFLLFIGTPPVLASSSIHISKVLTGGVSGLSHWRLGNVDKRMTLKLLLGGVSGGIVGAFVLSTLDGDVIKPFIGVYLMLMGLSIIWRSFQHDGEKSRRVHVMPLGAFGGFMDAIGGGGWGPIVTSTLLANGQNPRKSIGSVSFAESFVAVAVSVTLWASVTSKMTFNYQIVLGLIIGGVLAAPLAARLTGRLPVRLLMRAVGALVIALSLAMILTVVSGQQ